MFCPNCKKLIKNDSYWRCPFCNEYNGIKVPKGPRKALPFAKGKSFYEPCPECGKIGKYATCPVCEKPFMLNPNGDPNGTIELLGGLLDQLGKVATAIPEALQEFESKAGESGTDIRGLTDLKDIFDVFTGKQTAHDWEMNKLRQKKEKIELENQIAALAPKEPQDPKTAREKKEQEILDDLEASFMFETKRGQLLDDTKAKLADQAFAKYRDDPARLDQELKRIESLYMLLKFKGHK